MLEDKSSNSEFRKSTLKNGLRVVTEKVTGMASVHAGIFILWGTRNEEPHLGGIAHLIEHMVFKGTHKRSAKDIAYEIEAVGGDIGASTGREMTSYTVQCLHKDTELAIDVISDLVKNAKFDEEELKKEKEVVLSEISMTKENFEESVFDFAFEEIFKEHPLSKVILGTEESVNSITKEDLLKTYKKAYTPKQMILSVTGNIEHSEILKSAQKYLGDLEEAQSEEAKDKVALSTTPKFHSGTEFIKKDTEQTHVLINFPAPAYVDEDRLPSYIANIALGGGMTSTLFQSIREDKGLAYSVYSYLQCFLDTGVLSIYVATKHDKALEVVSLVIDEVTRLSKGGFKKSELELYRNQLLGEVLMGEDDLDSRMSSIALNELLFQKHRPVELVEEEVRLITADQMNLFFEKYFSKEPQIIILGSGKE